MKNLYDVARETCHALGLPWTDPRTGKTYQPPSKSPSKCFNCGSTNTSSAGRIFSLCHDCGASQPK